MMETHGWKANEKLQEYLDLLGGAVGEHGGIFATPMEWTNELVNMFGESFDIGNVHLLDSDGTLITELVASPGSSVHLMLEEAYKTVGSEEGQGQRVRRALNDVATLSVMATNPSMDARIPDGRQESDGKWTQPEYNNITHPGHAPGCH